MPRPNWLQQVEQRLQTRLQPLLDQLSDEWQELPPEKQRRFRLIAAVLVAALPFLLIVLPLIIGRVSAYAALSQARERLAEMRDLERSVLELRLNEDTHEQQPKETKNTSLIAVLDGIAQKAGVSSSVQSMRPVNNSRKDGDVEETVEVQLKGITLHEFVKLLYEIEVGNTDLTVKRLELNKETKTADVLRVSLEVAQ